MLGKFIETLKMGESGHETAVGILHDNHQFNEQLILSYRSSELLLDAIYQQSFEVYQLKGGGVMIMVYTSTSDTHDTTCENWQGLFPNMNALLSGLDDPKLFIIGKGLLKDVLIADLGNCEQLLVA